MAGNYRFEMDQKDIVRSLITTVGSFIQDRLIDREQRNQHKELCAERLAAEDGSSDKGTEVRYSDQAVLANLDWGIDALEEAISTSNMETKMARLDYAEKMLQVSAMLNASQKTAGVPNFYLSAWAHLNLSYLWMLRNNVHNAVLHILEMFIVDPFFSRIDFSPELWKHLFLPHMSSIVGWYSEERQRIVMDVIPDSSDLSFTMDFDNYFNESLILSVRPEQAEKIQELEQLYGQSLDENTRLYAKYYKDCINYDSATSRKVIPMLPIAEAPMTPLHELSNSIPDYVKFGPILPKSAGFSPVLKAKEQAREASRLNATSTSSENLEDSAAWHSREENPESEDFDDCPDAYIESKDIPREIVSNSGFIRTEKDDEASSYVSNSSTRVKDEGATLKRQPAMDNICGQSPSNSTRVNSPRSSTKISSPKAGTNSGKGPTSVLRLLSTRAMDSRSSTSLPDSPSLCDDNSIISPADSDGEMTGQQTSARESVGRAQSVRQVFPKSQDLLRILSAPSLARFFNDPVTLETGQTYERKAIQEWMNRGNTTCPITRQPLSATSLPKTNYVLKRLITSWKDQHPELAQEFSCTETPRSYLGNSSPKDMPSESILFPTSNLLTLASINNETEHKPRRLMRAALSTSPTSVISQAAVETVINALKPYTLCLCNSEDLQECEASVLTVARIWEDSKVDSGIHTYLSSPAIVNGFVEILSASLNRDVLRTTIYILSKLIYADDRVGGLLTSIDSDFYCLAALLSKGLAEAAVLMYLLRPSVSQLSGHRLISSLINILSNKNEDPTGLQFVIAPKDAAVALLEQIVMGGDESDSSLNAMKVISADGIPALLNCLNTVDGRQSIVSILLCCIRVRYNLQDYDSKQNRVIFCS
ncbi:putative E3 ubiquitin-protein ligase [Forsythia ovata]|uniref:E3 ubiquitin-protein ligase n=1 Tax=Forsythia ovata TaxID=205694 RepID=A0ABD1PWC2_9LAMI